MSPIVGFWDFGRRQGQTRDLKQHNRNLRLSVRLSIRLLRALDLPSDNILPYIILLAQVEEPPDLGSPLGTKTLWKHSVCESWDLAFALLDDDKGKNSNIGANDASTDRLAFAFTSPADSVAGVSVGKKKANTMGDKDTLLHGESLLVVATSDAENISFPFIPKRVARNFLCQFLVIK